MQATIPWELMRTSRAVPIIIPHFLLPAHGFPRLNHTSYAIGARSGISRRREVISCCGDGWGSFIEEEVPDPPGRSAGPPGEPHLVVSLLSVKPAVGEELALIEDNVGRIDISARVVSRPPRRAIGGLQDGIRPSHTGDIIDEIPRDSIQGLGITDPLIASETKVAEAVQGGGKEITISSANAMRRTCKPLTLPVASGVHRKNPKQKPQREMNQNVRSIASLRGLVSSMASCYRKGKSSYEKRHRSRAP
jgi:hypothetical protein